MARTKTEKIARAYDLASNPLRGLNSAQIERMIQDAKRGNDAKLQIAYVDVERYTPIFAVCLNKRLAGVTNREWKIEPVDDTPAAQAQAEAVQAMFEKSDTLNEFGLTEAIRHLGKAAFRGRAAVKPFVDADGLHFRKLENWNVFVRNSIAYWTPNPMEGEIFDDKNILPPHEVAWVGNDLPVDLPGISIYLRSLVGEQQWARFVEKEGIPQVVITPPEGTPDDDLQKWQNRAMALFEGGSGVLPQGSALQLLDSARGQDPFTSFLQHQMEMISILATGGTLATIGGSSGLGSNTAEVQNDQFESLVNADCKKIANAMTAVVVRKCALSMGQRPLCRFVFVEDAEYSAQDYLDMAVKLSQMGVRIDADKLREITRLDFIATGDQTGEELWTPNKTQNGAAE